MKNKFKLNNEICFKAKAEFIHNDEFNHSSAFNIDEDVIIKLYIPYNLGVEKCFLSIYADEQKIIEQVGVYYDMEKGIETYTFTIARHTENLL